MKKLISLIIVVICFSFCSCVHLDETLNESKVLADLIKCFNEKDLSGAEDLFSVSTKRKVNVIAQLKYAFDFYDSKSLKTKFSSGGGQSEVDNEYEYKLKFYDIEVKTQSHEYDFLVDIFTYHTDKNEIGISELKIICDNNYEKDKTIHIGTYPGEEWLSNDKTIHFQIEPYNESLWSLKESISHDFWGEISYNNKDYDVIVVLDKDSLTVYKKTDYQNQYDEDILVQGNINRINKKSFELKIEKVGLKKYCNYRKNDVIAFNTVHL